MTDTQSSLNKDVQIEELARENERLRSRCFSLEEALKTARDYVWDAKEGHLMIVTRCNPAICTDDLGRIDAALSGKDTV